MEKQRLEQKYDIVAKLGEGTYGKVYLATKKTTKERVAIKFYKPLSKNSEKLDEVKIDYTTLREASILKDLVHPNIVRLKEILFSSSEFCMVFEYCHMSLREYLNETKKGLNKLDHNVLKKFAYQIIQGVNHMHRNCLLHRDIKPCNILLDSHLNIKICDLGLARQVYQPLREYTNGVMTLNYRPPELCLGETRYSVAVDVWSIGCTLAEIALGEYLFLPTSDLDLLMAIFASVGNPSPDDLKLFNDILERKNCKLKLPHVARDKSFRQRVAEKKAKVPEQYIDLVESILVLNPIKRPTCAALLRHPFFK